MWFLIDMLINMDKNKGKKTGHHWVHSFEIGLASTLFKLSVWWYIIMSNY